MAIFSEPQARRNPFEDTPWSWASGALVQTN
jgi:hypothetical protein